MRAHWIERRNLTGGCTLRRSIALGLISLLYTPSSAPLALTSDYHAIELSATMIISSKDQQCPNLNMQDAVRRTGSRSPLTSTWLRNQVWNCTLSSLVLVYHSCNRLVSSCRRGFGPNKQGSKAFAQVAFHLPIEHTCDVLLRLSCRIIHQQFIL